MAKKKATVRGSLKAVQLDIGEGSSIYLRVDEIAGWRRAQSRVHIILRGGRELSIGNLQTVGIDEICRLLSKSLPMSTVVKLKPIARGEIEVLFP